MNNMINRSPRGHNAITSLLLVLGIFFVVGFACGRGGDSKPVPSEYVGAWTGDDGSTITIRGDSSGDYKSGGTSVSGGTVSVNPDNTLSITFVGVGPSLKIDKAPSGNQMTLGGVVYKKSGGSDTRSDKTSSSDTTTSKGDVPSEEKMQSLVKKTVLDFNDAVQSGDFSDFHDTVSQPLQKQASAEKLEGVFHEFIEKKANFSTVKGMDAKFSPSPAVEKDASSGFEVLHAKGYYPTSPRKTNFDLKYIDEDGDWKLSSIEINTKDQ